MVLVAVTPNARLHFLENTPNSEKNYHIEKRFSLLWKAELR